MTNEAAYNLKQLCDSEEFKAKVKACLNAGGGYINSFLLESMNNKANIDRQAMLHELNQIQATIPKPE